MEPITDRKTVSNASFDNSWYSPGASKFKILLWLLVNAFFLKSAMNPSSGIKKMWLRLFGAKIGKGVLIKPAVNIKYPWLLEIGDYAWIGEGVWIDNLAKVTIGQNVCLSQGAMLLTGNHDYKKSTFDLIVGEIVIEEGAWIGAQSIVCPGVTCSTHSILSVKSVATKDLDPYGIYQGNPAQKVRERIIS